MSSATIAAPARSPILTLLSRLALAIARRRSYGDAHPMVGQAAEALAEALIEHIEAHSSFAIAVAHRDLLVNGEVMPASNAVVRDIGTRLHLLGIGAVRFQRGLTVGAIGSLVELLARRPVDVSDSLPIPDMQGIVVGRMDYQQLSLADHASVQEEGQRLWHTLAERLLQQLASGNGAPGEVPATSTTVDAAPDPFSVLLKRAASSPAAAADAFVALSDLADRAAMAPRGVRDLVGEKLQELFAGLDDATLVATLQAAPGGARARFTATVVDMLPSGAMIRWLAVTAEANGRELSPHLLRLMTKLSTHQATRSPHANDQSLRETMLALVQGWELKEANPEEHHALLDTLADWSAQERVATGRLETIELDPISHEAIRLVQMACELDFLSDDAMQGVRYLADHGFTARLLEWAEQGTSEAMRLRLREMAITPQAMNDTLLATPFDAQAARHLLEAIPDSSAAILIGPLEACESRAGRRLIFDRLHRAGAVIELALRARLQQPMPWFLARNLLGLLRDIAAASDDATKAARSASGGSPTGPLLLFQSHEHHQVRREAVRLLAQYPSTRAAALRRALDDANDDVRLTAVDTILALRTVELPREVCERLLAVVNTESCEAVVREKSLRAAAMTMTSAARDDVRVCLLSHCTKRGLLTGLKLAPVTPLARTALQLLATHFATHADVTPVLARARRDGVLKDHPV